MPTAEEAAAANLAWRAVNAPETITASERAQATQYSQRYWTVERPAQEARDAAIQQTITANRQMINKLEGLSYGGAHTEQQLAALYGSSEIGRQAYAAEEEYYGANVSAEFQRINSEYEASKNKIVTARGSYAATGELDLNTTAGEGGFTGRAAEYKTAFEREVYGIGAPDNEREYYRRQAELAVVERPGYTVPSDLGDITTQNIRKGYGAFGQAIEMLGGEVASDYQMTGKFLEAQRQAAYETPQRRDERFFMGELQKWAEIPIEKASAYHYIGMESGERIPANPYEYQADLGVEFLKGAPKKASEFFSPVSGEMSKHLPGGMGVQEFAWEEAITDYKRQNVDARTPYPERVSFMEAVTYLGAAEGKYGPYGKLYGGIDTGGVDLGGGSLKRKKAVGGVGVSQLDDGVGIENAPSTLLNFQEVYATKQSEYNSMLKAYEAGGSSSKSIYDELLSRRKELIVFETVNIGLEQSRYQANLLFTPITEADVVKTDVITKRQSGALPLIGEIPYLSPAIASFEPEVTTTIKQYEAKGIFGGTVSASSVENTGGKTPFTKFVQRGALSPSAKEEFIKNVPSRIADIAGMPTAGLVFREMGAAEDIGKMVLPTKDYETMKSISGFVPGTREYWRYTYENTMEDPARGLAAAGLTVALVGVGTGARALGIGGIGSKFLTPISTSGKVYQAASTVISASMIGLYASNVSKRVTGSSLSEWVPIGHTKEEMGGGYFEGIQKRFPGLAESGRQLNIVETQELLPMAVAYKATSYIGDKFVGWARTRGVPENVNPRASGFMREEGFPKSDYITTRDLVDSFNTGTITLKNPAKLAETTMAPGGEPLTRIPVGSQIGAPEGSTFIYHSGEVPVTLMRGYVGSQSSEIPALFTAPQRLGYFTKAGTTGEGFGITSDILGLYKQPWSARIIVKSGVYQEIPSEILNAKYPETGLTINDPGHPKNVAIADWISGKTTSIGGKPLPKVEYGVPIISQYGKAEWQFEIPGGSEVGSFKMTSYYKDAGTRIPEYDVVFSGKKSAGYKPAEPVINPMTGGPVYEIGRVSMGFGYSSVSPSYRKAIPLGIISLMPSSIASTTKLSSLASGYSPKKYSQITSPSGASPSGFSKQSYSSKPSSASPSSISSRVSPPASSISSLISSPLKASYPSLGRSLPLFTTPSLPTSKPPYSITTLPSTPIYTPPYSPSTPKYTPTYTPQYTPEYTPEPPETPPPSTPSGGGGFLPGGGGGSRLWGNLGVRTWRRENLVATAEYLGRGMRDIGFGWGMGSGAYSENTKLFGTGKKRAKRRRKK